MTPANVAIPASGNPMTLSARLSRISGILLRHAAVYRFNKMRWQDFLFWPIVELLLWGFFAAYLRDLTTLTAVAAALLGAVLLWQVFVRTQQSVGISFLMELWSRNLLNVFTSPISVREYLAALLIFGVVKVLLLTGVLLVLISLFTGANLFALGPTLVLFSGALVLFGWAGGIFADGIILRFGQSAESLAFALAFLFQPFGAVFFPVSVYPPWLQSVLWWVPLPHIFESLRAVFQGQPYDPARLVWAYGLSLVYLALAVAFFGVMFERARERGFLLKLQE